MSKPPAESHPTKCSRGSNQSAWVRRLSYWTNLALWLSKTLTPLNLTPILPRHILTYLSYLKCAISAQSLVGLIAGLMAVFISATGILGTAYAYDRDSGSAGGSHRFNIRAFLQYPPYIASVAFSPDGRYILAVNVDLNTAYLVDTQTGETVQKFTHPDISIDRASFSPDGRYVLLSGGRCALVDIETGEEIKAFAQGIAAFSSDGRYIVTGSDDRVQLWNLETAEEVRTFALIKNVMSIAFSEDGRYIVTGSNYRAQLWNLETAEEVHKFSVIGNAISVAFSPNGRYILTLADLTEAYNSPYSTDVTTQLWDVATGEEIYAIPGRNYKPINATFSPDGRYILTYAADLISAKLLNVETGQEVHTFVADESGGAGMTGLAFSPDSRLALTGDYDGQMSLWDVETGKLVRTFEIDWYAVK